MKRARTLIAATIGLWVLAGCRDTSFPTAVPPTTKPDASADFGEGFILRDGKPMKVHFEIRDGRAIFQGDIDLGEADKIARTPEELLRPDGPRYGVVTDDLGKRWGNGIVPYVIVDFPNPARATDAMAHIQSRVAGVQFVPRTDHASYVVIRRTSDPGICGSSELGRTGGAQNLYVHDTCGTGTVIHELGHALGFWHEQSRCDRDQFVEILWGNIEPDRLSQFGAHCEGSDVDSYDEGSIMHYRKSAFGKFVNGVQLQTIRSLRGLDHLMGQRDSLAGVDINTVNWMYQPYPVSGTYTSYDGVHLSAIWSASNRASAYAVYLAIVYEEVNGYENWSQTWDHEMRLLGTTGQTSFVDTQNPYTGMDECYLWNEWYGYARYKYYYEVRANFPLGIWSAPARFPAAVASC